MNYGGQAVAKDKILLVFGFFDGFYHGQNNEGMYDLPLRVNGKDNILVVPFNISKDTSREKWNDRVLEIENKVDLALCKRLDVRPSFKPQELQIVLAGHGDKNSPMLWNSENNNDPKFRMAHLYDLGAIAGMAEPKIRSCYSDIKATKVKFLSCESMTCELTNWFLYDPAADWRFGLEKISSRVISNSGPEEKKKIYAHTETLKAIYDGKDTKLIGQAGWFVKGLYDVNPSIDLAKVSGVCGDSAPDGNGEKYSLSNLDGIKVIFRNQNEWMNLEQKLHRIDPNFRFCNNPNSKLSDDITKPEFGQSKAPAPTKELGSHGRGAESIDRNIKSLTRAQK